MFVHTHSLFDFSLIWFVSFFFRNLVLNRQQAIMPSLYVAKGGSPDRGYINDWVEIFRYILWRSNLLKPYKLIVKISLSVVGFFGHNCVSKNLLKNSSKQSLYWSYKLQSRDLAVKEERGQNIFMGSAWEAYCFTLCVYIHVCVSTYRLSLCCVKWWSFIYLFFSELILLNLAQLLPLRSILQQILPLPNKLPQPQLIWMLPLMILLQLVTLMIISPLTITCSVSYRVCAQVCQVESTCWLCMQKQALWMINLFMKLSVQKWGKKMLFVLLPSYFASRFCGTNA